VAEGTGVSRIILAKREGQYAPWWHEIVVRVHGGKAYSATLGGKTLAASGTGVANSFRLPDLPGGGQIELTYK